jgi:hypothetical protein
MSNINDIIARFDNKGLNKEASETEVVETEAVETEVSSTDELSKEAAEKEAFEEAYSWGQAAMLGMLDMEKKAYAGDWVKGADPKEDAIGMHGKVSASQKRSVKTSMSAKIKALCDQLVEVK